MDKDLLWSNILDKIKTELNEELRKAQFAGDVTNGVRKR